jgi:hypothetical protein
MRESTNFDRPAMQLEWILEYTFLECGTVKDEYDCRM